MILKERDRMMEARQHGESEGNVESIVKATHNDREGSTSKGGHTHISDHK